MNTTETVTKMLQACIDYRAMVDALEKENEILKQEKSAAIASWDEERMRALREAGRVMQLKCVVDDMLSTFDDEKTKAPVTAERIEGWRTAVCGLFQPNTKAEPRAQRANP